MVCVGLFAAFDREKPQAFLRTEQDFWKEAPAAFAAIGQAPVLDAGLPKPGGEILVAGLCRAPGNTLVQAQEVAFRVGGLMRRIAVFGDRQRLPGGGVSEPLPFASMPLVWERAFGGPQHAPNPAGKGLAENNKSADFLPNLEDPDHLIVSANDRPHPVCPLPIPFDNPVRRGLSGTYDTTWQDTRWPAYPDDCHPEFFHSAQPWQRLAQHAGHSPFFTGHEDIEIIGMRHDLPHIRASLPKLRIRAFVLTAERFIPFADTARAAEESGKKKLPYAKNLDAPGLFREVKLHCDTIWLLPDMMGAYPLRRGLLPVEDDEMDDVLRVLVVTENAEDEPQSLEYYREELRKRAYPSVEVDLAPLVEAQAHTAKAVKIARDVPKFLDSVKKNALGQKPSMPLSLGDISHSTHKTFATGRATLDTVEKEMLSLRDQFSHQVSFDLSMFAEMRTMITKQEADFNATMKDLAASMDKADASVKKSIDAIQAKVKAHLEISADATPFEKANKEAAAAKLQADIAKLDALSPEGLLCEPQPLEPWHDRGFPLVIAARRALIRDDALLARLAAMGLEEQTLDTAWIGHAQTAFADSLQAWGLAPLPQGNAFCLPAGLYVPRFDGNALCALRVYPLDDVQNGVLRGLGQDASAQALVPGSSELPLSLPASYPDGAVLVLPDDLSALFAEQESGDFCHIVACADPAKLADIADLPPLAQSLSSTAPKDAPQPDVLAELPLVVVLPPLPEGKALFAPWQQANAAAIPLYLPEGCPHVLALAEQGHRFRRLLLDVLPPDLAATHDFYFPLPPKDRPPEPFTLNLPLPSKEELQERIVTLIDEMRAHFPDPQKLLAETFAAQRPLIEAGLKQSTLPPKEMAKAMAALHAPVPPAPPTRTVAEITRNSLEQLASMQKRIAEIGPPEVRDKVLAQIRKAEDKTRQLGADLAPLDDLLADGMKKLEAHEKGILPEEVQAAFDKEGMDPHALRLLSREEVQAILAGDKNLERRNLLGLDLSGLDFSGAKLAHALCNNTSFSGCNMEGANFFFTLAGEADFSGARLVRADMEQSVLQKAILKNADCSEARLYLSTFGESDLSGAIFDRADIKLCNFAKARLADSRFYNTLLSLCSFSEIKAPGADFTEIRAFKCLFQQADLRGALFHRAVLNECLFQGCLATGLPLVGAELRKFYTDADTDLSNADFSHADLREASMRMTRFCNADFYQANLENALIAMCDLSQARLDGLKATGCRFIKCDLAGADLSGIKLNNGALRKCRVTGADLRDSNLFAANLRNLTLDKNSRFEGANLKKTLLAGKEEALHDVTRRRS